MTVSTMYVAFKANAMNLKFIILVFQFKLTITDQVQVIRTVFEDDPVTREHLDTGWKIVDYQTDCARRIEDLELCEKCDLIENTSWDKTLHLLSHCRRKCQEEFHNSSEQLPEIVEHLGGLEDFLEQPFGFSLPVCSLREGYSKSQVLSGQIFTKFLNRRKLRNFLMTEMNKDLRSLGYDNVLITKDEGQDDVFVHTNPK